MQKELIVALTRIERIKGGHIYPKKLKLIKKNKQILRVIKNKNKMSKLSFLKKIAENIILN